MNDTELTGILKSSKTIAVVGLSSNPARASFGVSRFLQRQGFRIIPVNPQETEVLGERAYPSLKDVPDPVDIVNIFRRPARVPEVVDEAIQKGGAMYLDAGGCCEPRGRGQSANCWHSSGNGSLYFERTRSSPSLRRKP